MNKWFRIILILATIGIIAALYIYFFVYNKSHPDYANLKPDYELTAKELFDSYKTNKSFSDSLYTGKMIQITGSINKWEEIDSLQIAIMVFDQGMFGDEGIRCTMIPGQPIQEDHKIPDKTLQIKGLCTGYNDTDVILEKCTIVK